MTIQPARRFWATTILVPGRAFLLGGCDGRQRMDRQAPGCILFGIADHMIFGHPHLVAICALVMSFQQTEFTFPRQQLPKAFLSDKTNGRKLPALVGCWTSHGKPASPCGAPLPQHHDHDPFAGLGPGHWGGNQDVPGCLVAALMLRATWFDHPHPFATQHHVRIAVVATTQVRISHAANCYGQFQSSGPSKRVCKRTKQIARGEWGLQCGDRQPGRIASNDAAQ